MGEKLHLAVKTYMFDQEAGPNSRMNEIRAVYLIAGVEPCRTRYQFSMYWLVSVLRYSAFGGELFFAEASSSALQLATPSEFVSRASKRKWTMAPAPGGEDVRRLLTALKGHIL